MFEFMDIPRLHPDPIEQVKAKVDIIDAVGEYVPLKKRGNDDRRLWQIIWHRRSITLTHNFSST